MLQTRIASLFWIYIYSLNALSFVPRCQPTHTPSFFCTLAYVTPRHSSTSLADGRAPWAPGPPSFLPATQEANRNRNIVRLHNASSLVLLSSSALLLLWSRSKDMQWSKGKFCATRLMMYPAMKASPAPVVSTTVASRRVPTLWTLYRQESVENGAVFCCLI